jgi:hypothetical protein
MKKSMKDLLLVIICANSGRYSWYQLNRELEWRGIRENRCAGDIVDGLIKDGLVVELTENDRPGLPIYYITDKGRDWAHEIVDKYGLDSFKITKQNPEDYE